MRGHFLEPLPPPNAAFSSGGGGRVGLEAIVPAVGEVPKGPLREPTQLPAGGDLRGLAREKSAR